jgi:hypothetical protein
MMAIAVPTTDLLRTSSYPTVANNRPRHSSRTVLALHRGLNAKAAWLAIHLDVKSASRQLCSVISTESGFSSTLMPRVMPCSVTRTGRVRGVSGCQAGDHHARKNRATAGRGDDTTRHRDRVRSPGCRAGLEGYRREPARGSWDVARWTASGKTQCTWQDRASRVLEICRP